MALHAVAAVRNVAERLHLPGYHPPNAWAVQAAVWAPPLWRLLVARAPVRSDCVRSPT